MPVTKPLETEYPPFYQTYIGKVKNDDLIGALNQGCRNFIDLISNIPADKLSYRYAEGKWTIKGVIAHVIDNERVFAYRALTFARNDKSELPGYDEELWAPESNAENRSIESLIEEYRHLRQSNIRMFEGFTDEMLLRVGTANGNKISVRALGYVLPGHELHHMQTIRERYLS